jgi:hypothetical protein
MPRNSNGCSLSSSFVSIRSFMAPSRKATAQQIIKSQTDSIAQDSAQQYVQVHAS